MSTLYENEANLYDFDGSIVSNLKQKEAQSARAESTHKVLVSKMVNRTQTTKVRECSDLYFPVAT